MGPGTIGRVCFDLHAKWKTGLYAGGSTCLLSAAGRGVAATTLLLLLSVVGSNTSASDSSQPIAAKPAIPRELKRSAEATSLPDFVGKSPSAGSQTESAKECVANTAGEAAATESSIHGQRGDITEAKGVIAHDCIATIGTILTSWRRGDVTIVDVRKPADYEQYRIPGAINIPQFAVRTKAFLKSKNTVLVNTGRSYGGLLQTCERLKREGYTRISVLDGGMLAWTQRSAPIQGTRPSLAQLARISPQEFAAALYDRNWIVIHEVQEKNDPVISIHDLPVIRFRGNRRSLKSEISELLGKKKITGPMGILLVSQQNPGLLGISQVLHELPIRHVVSLVGGSEAYSNYQSQQRMFAARPVGETLLSRRCGG